MEVYAEKPGSVRVCRIYADRDACYVYVLMHWVVRKRFWRKPLGKWEVPFLGTGTTDLAKVKKWVEHYGLEFTD